MSLESILNQQSELYDLHTHLLGMGSADFWVSCILEKPDILPVNREFDTNGDVCEKLCRLIWNDRNKQFINGKRAAWFIKYLIDQDYPRRLLKKQDFSKENVSESEWEVFHELANKGEFVNELQYYELGFQNSFSYDVILDITDLAKGLGVNQKDILVQTVVEEKLGYHTSPVSDKPLFQHWIIFNAREQRFQIVFGMTVEQLRPLIKKDPNTHTESNKIVRSHIFNAFSMCSTEGTTADHIDLTTFHGAFTPEFYPRRFALKDSIYSQRLDVLAHLLVHILLRYKQCSPPVKYCEFSIGVGDVTRPWVFDVLCSFPAISDSLGNYVSSFRTLIHSGHFPELGDACGISIGNKQSSTNRIPDCIYKFLAGFDRQKIQSTKFKDQSEALKFLNETPQLAIHLMTEEINKSYRKQPITKNDIFYPYITHLDKIENSAAANHSFYDWVVGLDLFGDEMGYPYCPFVIWEFIDYVKNRRQKNRSFGLRIHCGENVPFADANSPAYRHFAAHMYIVFRCLRYLQHRLEYGIRIGHGIAFERILNGSMSSLKHRKSSVLLAEIKEHARHVFKTIAFEVNITSNEYLLGHALRRGDFDRILQFTSLIELGAPVVLATDDDGIWPIDHCGKKHSGHQSLAAEYCRAISSPIITSRDVLTQIFNDTKRFRFYANKGEWSLMPRAQLVLPDDVRKCSVVIHPDVTKLIIRLCRERDVRTGKFYNAFARVYLQEPPNPMDAGNRPNNETDWDRACRRLAPLAYLSYYSDELKVTNERQQIQDEYYTIFQDNPAFKTVFDEWTNIHQKLIEPNLPNQSACEETTMGSCKHVFFSLEGPLTTCSNQSKPMEVFMEYLQQNYNKGIHIHSYTSHINIVETVDAMKTQLLLPCHADLSVFIYSNKDKEQYIPFSLDGKFRLQINPNPTRRTDCNREDQQNGLYAVCPHASAATAFLHFVAKNLSIQESLGPPELEHQVQGSQEST